MTLDRAGILGLCTNRRPKVEEVSLPDGAGTVFVRVMSGIELDDYETGHYERDNKSGRIVYRGRNSRGRLAARCICDKDGNRLFPNDGEADLLGRMDGPTLDAIYQAAQTLNGLSQASKEEKEKNSPTPEAPVASGTDSPGTSAAV